MKRGFSDWAHLIRLTLLLAAAGLAFLVVRAFFIPATFGDLGHYRAAAVVEARERPVHYAERTSCETCHVEVIDLQKAKASKHAPIGCQSCHGPLAEHVDSAGEVKPVLPEVVPLCARCHQLTAGRPSRMPQVDAPEHSGGERCTTCHQQHAPGIS